MKSIKRLKPLIKLELKPVMWIGIYLMLVNVCSFIGIKQGMNNLWRDYTVGGIGCFYNRYGRLDLIRILYINITSMSILAYLLGMLILSFVSFKQDKSLETSRFLKALPYTSGERSLVKVSLGSLGYTINFILYSVGIVIMQRACSEKVREIYEVTPIGQIQDQLFNTPKLLMMLFVLYIIGLALYLFFVLVQYIVSHRIGSVIITLCVLGAPFFLIESIGYCFRLERGSLVYELSSWLNGLTIGVSVPMRVRIQGFESRMSWYSITEYMVGYRIIFYMVIIGVCLLGIWKLSKHQLLEEVDKLIAIKGFRAFFIMGVTLCGSFLVGDIYLWFIDPLLASSISGAKWFVLVVGAIISFMIAKKIAFIGFNKRKEVKA